MNQLIGSSSLRASQSKRRDDLGAAGFYHKGRSGRVTKWRAEVPPDLLLEDLAHRSALVVAGDLAFRRVALRDRQPLGGSELVSDRPHPLGKAIEAGAGGNRLASREVDQLAGEPVPDRPPEVFLDQAVRQVR